MIENEQFNHIDKDFSQIPNVQTNDHTEIESLTYSPHNGNLLLLIHETNTLHFVEILLFTILP